MLVVVAAFLTLLVTPLQFACRTLRLESVAPFLAFFSGPFVIVWLIFFSTDASLSLSDYLGRERLPLFASALFGLYFALRLQRWLAVHPLEGAVWRTGPRHAPSALERTPASTGMPTTRQWIGYGFVVSVFAVLIAMATRDRIWSDGQLEEACRQRTRTVLEAHGSMPSDWTPSMHSDWGDVFHFHGSWRVGSRRVRVLCSATQGDLIETAGFEIGEPE